ncbi:peptidase S28 [Polychytrium aggregatum]|uniref:peptidase S28 n=1 Tax=Polychytrium aggregatum TaxID=110093 RepID=UPI0022FE322E|nr:peptidase S28 [Polychytrium aggregatum]KAI9209514.1 peptidase S28 [Polychytrium aggregatum]
MVLWNTVWLVALALPAAVLGTPFLALAGQREGRRQSLLATASTISSFVSSPSQWIYQPLDHFDPTNRQTLRQKYYVNNQFYQPGGPVWFYIGGESALTAELAISALDLHYVMAQQTNGMIVALEHRFYGDSNPYYDYSIANLKYLSSEQAIEDAAAFAKNFTASNNLPACTKWIAVGGSYAGNLAAWSRELHPDVFWAAHSSSAPLTSKLDFWEFSYGVRLGIPLIDGGSQTCADNLVRVTSLFDQAIQKDPNATRQYLGFGDVLLNGDIAGFLPGSSLAGSVQYGPVGQSFNGSATQIDAVCSGKFFPSFANPNSTNEELWTDLKKYMFAVLKINGVAPNNNNDLVNIQTGVLHNLAIPARLWYWQLCTEFGNFLNAEHVDVPIYSKTLNPDYQQQVCSIIFDNAHSVPDTTKTNGLYKATDIGTDRIVFVNGAIDPWHWLGIYNRTSTEAQPVFYHDQFHCDDLYIPLPSDTPTLRQVKLDIQATWLSIIKNDTCPSEVNKPYKCVPIRN